MDFIIGGAHQGKLDYARRRYGLEDRDLFLCDETTLPDFSRRCVARLEEYVFGCVRRGEDPVAFFAENHEKWTESVLICRDIFCGVVPLGADVRRWREETGRLCAYLAGEASSVVRLFFSIPQTLK